MTEKTFKVVITEFLSEELSVKATSEDEAIKKVKKLYHNEEIVLDADDFNDCVEFTIF